MKDQKRAAFKFIILLGVVSLFGDITYEGARSITGPYLAVLGASAGIVGLVSGLGEFIGYGLRLVSGYFTDRTKAYWPLTFIGYGLILSIPFLAFTHYWQTALIFIIMERMGKAIRSPARDAILSHATAQVGRGFGFGIHEAMDQIGAVIGPLIFSLVFILKGGYREGFTILWIPAVLTLGVLLIARLKVSSPVKFEEHGLGQVVKEDIKNNPERTRIFWLYILFIFLSVAGFLNFQLISYHLKVKAIVSDAQIPLFYAIAMAVDAFVAIIIGKTYDRIGLKSLLTIPALTLCIPIFALSSRYSFLVIAVILWGAVMGIHETIMRAAIADITHIEKRGFAYGVFNAAYGFSWFFGSSVMGFLYGISNNLIIIFVIMMEIFSLPVFLLLKKASSRK
ncbi:MAG: MFS transporter [Candidatus Omnitrophica bacterium CG1_02_40_15]|nr:MAG: MFS transporter [Candidatus Omnitrophica bacterium CG1_02_40_15]